VQIDPPFTIQWFVVEHTADDGWQSGCNEHRRKNAKDEDQGLRDKFGYGNLKTVLASCQLHPRCLRVLVQPQPTRHGIRPNVGSQTLDSSLHCNLLPKDTCSLHGPRLLALQPRVNHLRHFVAAQPRGQPDGVDAAPRKRRGEVQKALLLEPLKHLCSVRSVESKVLRARLCL